MLLVTTTELIRGEIARDIGQDVILRVWGGNVDTSHGRRRSLSSQWLHFASSSGNNPQRTLHERELARRSDLIAWLALGMLGGLVIVSPIAIGDNAALLTYLCFLALQLAAISLNRAGHITIAGIILVVSMNAAIFAYMWSSPLGLTMGQLPNYDALAVSVVIAASVLPRRSAFIVAAINAGTIVADYLIRPHNANVALDAALYPSATVQTVSLLVRPIALQFIMALVAFLWVRGSDLAVRRADRAEEIAMLEFRELERTNTLEEGVLYLHQTLAQWAQGNFARRVPAMPLEILEAIRNDLNGFMERYGPNMDATYYLQLLQNEVGRLTSSLESWLRGQPVIWPEPGGTPLDRAFDLLRSSGARPASYSSPQSAPIRPTGAPRFTPGPPLSPYPPGNTPPPRPTGAPYAPPPSNPLAPPGQQPFGTDGAFAPDDDPGNHWP